MYQFPGRVDRRVSSGRGRMERGEERPISLTGKGTRTIKPTLVVEIRDKKRGCRIKSFVVWQTGISEWAPGKDGHVVCRQHECNWSEDTLWGGRATNLSYVGLFWGPFRRVHDSQSSSRPSVTSPLKVSLLPPVWYTLSACHRSFDVVLEGPEVRVSPNYL